MNRQYQRGFALLVCFVDVRFFRQQRSRAIDESKLGRQNERRIALFVRKIGIGTLLQQKGEPGIVAALHYDMQGRLSGGMIARVDDHGARSAEKFGRFLAIAVLDRFQKIIAVRKLCRGRCRNGNGCRRNPCKAQEKDKFTGPYCARRIFTEHFSPHFVYRLRYTDPL